MFTLEQVLGQSRGNVHFTGVNVLNRNLVYLRALLKSLDEKQVDHSLVFRFMDGDWGQFMLDIPSTSHWVTDENGRSVYTLSPHGEVHIADPMGFRKEYIDTTDGGPSELRAMTCIKQIAGQMYAAGMARIFYIRNRNGVWERLDSGSRDNKIVDPIGGFKSFDGFSSENIYAVGFKGEIWRFNGVQWELSESPTNVKLESCFCASDGHVYICGACGVILKGLFNRWTIIPNDLTEKTLWSVCEFHGKIYLSDNENIYLYNGVTIEQVDTGIQGKSTSYLHSNDRTLWSVGESSILRTNDAATWDVIFQR